MQYLLDLAEDNRQRVYLINCCLERFRGTLYRQTMSAEFEPEIYRMTGRGEGLTSDALSAYCQFLSEQHFGKAMSHYEEIRPEWARIPHFYCDSCVYQYAAGCAAAIALSEKILKEDAPAAERYLNFLMGGCSQLPIDLLQRAGVDATTPAPIDEALRFFDRPADKPDGLLR